MLRVFLKSLFLWCRPWPAQWMGVWSRCSDRWECLGSKSLLCYNASENLDNSKDAHEKTYPDQFMSALYPNISNVTHINWNSETGYKKISLEKFKSTLCNIYWKSMSPLDPTSIFWHISVIHDAQFKAWQVNFASMMRKRRLVVVWSFFFHNGPITTFGNDQHQHWFSFMISRERAGKMSEMLT